MDGRTGLDGWILLRRLVLLEHLAVLIITFRVGVAVTLATFASSFSVTHFLRLRILALDEGDHRDDDHYCDGDSDDDGGERGMIL